MVASPGFLGSDEVCRPTSKVSNGHTYREDWGILLRESKMTLRRKSVRVFFLKSQISWVERNRRSPEKILSTKTCFVCKSCCYQLCLMLGVLLLTDCSNSGCGCGSLGVLLLKILNSMDVVTCFGRHLLWYGNQTWSRRCYKGYPTPGNCAQLFQPWIT
ncbi:unnamed protein product [Lathyrus sativus]|nr:unnamed protein product [Lathyrus sativus]